MATSKCLYAPTTCSEPAPGIARQGYLDSNRFTLLFWRRDLVRVVRGIDRKLRVVDALVVADRVDEALVRHLAVVIAGHAVRGHDSLHRLIVVVDFVFLILLPVRRISPLVLLFQR